MNFTSSERDFVKDNEAYVPVADSDKRRIESLDELERLLALRDEADGGELGRKDGRLNMMHCVIKGLDLAGRDMTGLDLSRSTFDGCDLRGTDFTGSKMDNVAFYDNKLTGMILRNCLARGCSFRFQDMTDIDLRGANIYSSVLEDALNQDKVITDDDTKWYKMRCPEEGEPFIA